MNGGEAEGAKHSVSNTEHSRSFDPQVFPVSSLWDSGNPEGKQQSPVVKSMGFLIRERSSSLKPHSGTPSGFGQPTQVL